MYHCVLCTSQFLTRANLASHLSVTHKRILCSSLGCLQTFKDKRYAVRHYAAKHSGTAKNYQCSSCLKVLQSRSGFYLHKTNICPGAVSVLVEIDMGSTGVSPAIAGSSDVPASDVKMAIVPVTNVVPVQQDPGVVHANSGEVVVAVIESVAEDVEAVGGDLCSPDEPLDLSLPRSVVLPADNVSGLDLLNDLEVRELLDRYKVETREAGTQTDVEVVPSALHGK